MASYVGISPFFAGRGASPFFKSFLESFGGHPGMTVLFVARGIVPVAPLRRTQCLHKRDGRDKPGKA